MLGELANHLWQSTLFALAVWLLTFVFRRNKAEVRYWMWFSASFKFFVPFSLLAGLGSRWTPTVHEMAIRVAVPAASLTMTPIYQPFPHVPSLAPVSGSDRWLIAIAIVWVCGLAAITLARLREWRRIQAAVRSGALVEDIGFDLKIAVRSSPCLIEPGVVGIFRPVLLLPAELTKRLTSAQLEAVLAHELYHVRRRDNLFVSIHMIAEAVFWFHPLVWWIGARLVEERERACDEEVLARVRDPQIYAEGILNVCRLYAESPLACVAGVTGADIRRRIENIMANRIGRRLTCVHKLLLASAGFAVMAVPFVIGIGNAPAVRAQTPGAPAAQFDVASIRPNNSGANTLNVRLQPGGRVRAINATLRSLITAAYSLPDLRLSGGPAWVDSARFDVDARGQGKDPTEVLGMLQTLLADRFQLKVRWETRELPIYALLIAKSGPKLNPPLGTGCFDPISLPAGTPPPAPKPGEGPVRPCGGFNIPVAGQMYGAKVPMWRFAMNLTRILGRTVVNKTGLDGPYDITLQWDPNESQNLPAPDQPQPPDNSAPSIFTAVQEQLGLRLESQRGPVEVLVIERAEKPSEN